MPPLRLERPMDNLLVLLKNVVLSALHGWVGASLAVFMFFRPLKPWRIGGVKIWHGVIPAQQQIIGAAIGGVVAEELLTPAAILDYLDREGALEQWVGATVHELADELADRDYAALEDILPRAAADFKEEIKKQTATALARLVQKYLKEPDTQTWLKDVLRERLAPFWRKRLGEICPEEEARGFFILLLSKTERYLAEPRFSRAVADMLEYLRESLCAKDVSLGEFLPRPILEKIDQWPAGLAEVLPVLVTRLKESDEVMERLTATILETMERMKEQGLLARIGIGLFQFFNEYQKEVELFVRREMFPRLSDFLASPEAKMWLEKGLREQARAILAKPVGELAAGLNRRHLDAISDWLAARLERWFREASTKAWLEEFLLERYQTLAEKQLADLCQQYIRLSPTDVTDRLAEYGFTLLDKPTVAELLESAAGSFMDAVAAYPVGRFRDRLAPGTISRAESLATGVIISFIRSRVPAFLEQIDAKAIVQGKIESYSTGQLVEMFHKVTMNSLRKIEGYGAAIGAVMGVLIGLANLRADAFGITVAALLAVAVLLRMGK